MVCGTTGIEVNSRMQQKMLNFKVERSTGRGLS